MVATMKVYCDFGGTDGSPGTEQDATALGSPNVRFKTADNNTIDSNAKLVKPSAGNNYSYWKSIYLKCTVAPSVQIDNIKIYTDGTGYGTGITTNVGDETPVKNSGASSGYVVATGTEGTSGDELVANNSEISAVTDFFTYTDAAAKDVSISESGNVIDDVDETSNYVILQIKLDNTVTSGQKSVETITFQYDEV